MLANYVSNKWRIWPRRSSLSCFFFLGILFGCVSAYGEQPSWFKNLSQDFPRNRFLVGLGMATGQDRAERMQVAEENARSNLIKSIRTHISSEFIDSTTETHQQLDRYTQSRVVSNVSLEVDGIEIMRQEDTGKMAYALEKKEARVSRDPTDDYDHAENEKVAEYGLVNREDSLATSD